MERKDKSATANAAVVHLGEATQTILSSTAFLQKYSEGVYTTSRTIDGNKVFELDKHVNRLVDSATKLILDSQICQENDVLLKRRLSFNFLKQEVVSNIISGITYLREHADTEHPIGIEMKEFRITILLTWEKIDETKLQDWVYDLHLHIMELPPVSFAIKVHLVYGVRPNPNVKSVAWASGREVYAKTSPSDAEETVLMEEDGSVTEGLSSNFFVLKNGSLFTAPTEMVLSGMVRNIILESCVDMGIPVHEECPNINEVEEWDGCFISSSSRGIRCVQALVILDTSKTVQYNPCNTGLIFDIVNHAHAACAKKSEFLNHL